jgi:hypothetical protein
MSVYRAPSALSLGDTVSGHDLTRTARRAARSSR